MVLYIFKKIFSRSIETISHLLPTLLTLHRVYLILLITFISLLSIIRLYISLYNKTTFIKSRIISYISRIINIEKTDFNFLTNVTISLAMYFEFYFNCLFAAKDFLYLAKTVIGLPITYNISKMTQKSNLTTDFLNIRAIPNISVIYKNI